MEEKEIYQELLSKLTVIGDHFEKENFDAAFKEFDTLKNEVEEKVDKHNTREIADILTDTKYFNEFDVYADIVRKAAELGVQYIGVKKSDLAKMVNDHLMKYGNNKKVI